MADHSIGDDVRDTVEDQIRELRAQVANISKSLSDSGFDLGEIKDEAGHFVDATVHHVQDEAATVARAARDAPAATGTVLTLAGAIGFGLGYLFAISQLDTRRHWWR